MPEIRKYKEVTDDPVLLPKGKHFFELACCDCSLVHRIYYTTEEKENLFLFFERDNRATGQLRRHNNGQLQNKSVGKWKMIKIKD